MKKLISLSMALALGSASLQIANAAETAAQRAGRVAIAAACREQDRAMVKGDVATMMARMAPDFQMVTAAGQTLNREQTAAMMQRTLSGAVLGVPVKYTKSSTRIVSLTWRGPEAIVMSETTAVATASGRGRAVNVEQVSLARDLWSPMAGGWKIRQSVERSSKMWVNGKRIQ